MLWSGSSPKSVLRDSVWGFLLLAGMAWLAIAWSVLRLEPADVVTVAGAMIFFGALCEGVRALAGMRTWWLNAGVAVLFTGIGAIVVVDADATFATTASLVGWFLMVRGALDVAVSTMNRGVDRTWGLVLSLGVVQAGLGFFAAGPLFRSADLTIVTLGGLALLRGVADLVTALRLREVSAARHDVLDLSPERAEGVAGYAAGRGDAELLSGARHRAEGLEGISTAGGAGAQLPHGAQLGHDPRAAEGSEVAHGAEGSQVAHGAEGPQVAHGAEGSQVAHDAQGAEGSQVARGAQGAEWAQVEGAQGAEEAQSAEPTRGVKPNYRPGSFHDEVVQSTKDLDAMIAQAGVTGTGAAATRVPEDLPPAPASPEEMTEKQRP